MVLYALSTIFLLKSGSGFRNAGTQCALLPRYASFKNNLISVEKRPLGFGSTSRRLLGRKSIQGPFPHQNHAARAVSILEFPLQSILSLWPFTVCPYQPPRISVAVPSHSDFIF